jgi:hypothetical protein
LVCIRINYAQISFFFFSKAAASTAAAAAPIAFQITQNLVPTLNNNVCKQQ